MLWANANMGADNGECNTIATAEATVRRIRHVIGGIMTYIVRALLSSSASHLPLLAPENIPGEPSHYYVMITICYVVQKYPKAEWSWQAELNDKGIKDNEQGKEWELGALGRRLPSRRANPLVCSNHAVTKVKYSLLEWLHYEAISALQTDFSSPRVIPPQWVADKPKIEALQNMAKTELVRRVASLQPYQADDEISDRLAFLAEEMWPDIEASEQPANRRRTAKYIADRITRRVEEREYTRAINLCHAGPGKGGADDSPWEVHALCHHSRLVVAHKRACATEASPIAWEDAQLAVEHYRKKFYPFLTSEASLMPCWERNNSSARRGFLRSEATAVLASTILEIFQSDFEHCNRPATGLSKLWTDRRLSIVLQGSDAGGDNHDSASAMAEMRSHGTGRQGDLSSLRHLRHTGEKANVEALLVQQLETLERLANARGLERHIDYLKFRPPQRYHPEEFFNSLDDTPELYDSCAIDKADLAIPAVIREALSKHMSLEDDGPHGDLVTELVIDEDPTNRLRELLVKVPPGPVDKNLQARVAATMLRKLTVIDLITPDPLPSLKPRPIRNKDIVRVVSDSVSWLTRLSFHCTSFSPLLNYPLRNSRLTKLSISNS